MGENLGINGFGERCPALPQEETKLLLQLHGAAEDLIRWQEKLWLLFLREIGITPTQYFAEHGANTIRDNLSIGNNEWLYTFHGVECDFHHVSDGRGIQIEPLFEGQSPGTVGISSLSMFLQSMPLAERPQYDALFKACFRSGDWTGEERLNIPSLLRLLETAAARSVLIPLLPQSSPWYRLGRCPK